MLPSEHMVPGKDRGENGDGNETDDTIISGIERVIQIYKTLYIYYNFSLTHAQLINHHLTPSGVGSVTITH